MNSLDVGCTTPPPTTATVSAQLCLFSTWIGSGKNWIGADAVVQQTQYQNVLIQYDYHILQHNIQKVISMYIFLKNLCLILVSNFILVAR